MRKYTFYLAIFFVYLSAFIFVCCGQCRDKPVSPHAVLPLEDLHLPFNLGQRVVFRCEYGYGVQDSSPRAKCIRDRNGFTWEYSGGICKPLCMDFPISPHSKIIESRQPPFYIDEKVGFHCEIGYGSFQYRQAWCRLVEGKAQWVLPEVECELVHCEAPLDVEKATRIDDGTYTYLKNVTYHCNLGFEIMGESTLTCNAVGNWEPKYPPYCKVITCPSLTFPKHGYVKDYGHDYNTVAEYFCDKGYHLDGNTYRTCQADRTWTGSEPTCVTTVCFDPGPLENGRIYKTKTEFQEGDTIIYACDDDSARYSAKCLKNGEWSERPPLCKPGSNTPSTSTTPLTTTSTTSTTLTPTNATSSDLVHDLDSHIKNIYTVTIAVTVSLLLATAIAVIALLCYRKRKVRFTKKAQTADAVYYGELKKLEKARRKY